MDFISHTVGGIALGAGANYLAREIGIEPNSALLVGAAALGGLLPDIDHPQSFLGRKLPLLPDLLYSFVGHRTLTHSFFFTFIIGLIGLLINPWVSLGLVLGILSHIALDMLSPYGVSFLYPFHKERIKLKKYP